MKYGKTDGRKDAVGFLFGIAAVIIILGAILSCAMYVVIQKSFFQATVTHEMELMRIMEQLGSQVTDDRLHDLKAKTKAAAEQYGEELIAGTAEEKIELLSSMELDEYRLNFCYQTRDGLYQGRQFQGNRISQLDLSEAWEGSTVLFSPDFDEEGNYILVVAAPVWKDQEVVGILLEQLDGYCISDWIGDLFLSLDLGTAYIIDGSGRNIATAREENFDWITTRYNSQDLVKESDDESTRSIARLEKQALEGKTGIDTYVWEGSTNYVAYGPLTEADWGFYVGFYGTEFLKYTQEITSISSRAASVMLVSFAVFSGAVVAVVIRSLGKERRYSEALMKQKEEIQHQALRIAASEERFRMAMQRSRDVILEYQFETGEVTFFYMGRERKSGQVGSRVLRRYLVEEGGMQEDSYERFEEVIRAIGKGLTSAECLIIGGQGEGSRWYNMSVSVIPDGIREPTRAVGVLRDVTGEHEAKLDPLTRLLNKGVMIKNMRDAMEKNLPDTAGAFVILDVDHFKLVNDKYGHPAGDRVLQRIADALRETFPEPYLTGRFGGDEFCIYCPADVEPQSLERRLKEFAGRVRGIQLSDGSFLDVSLSMGAVIFYGKALFETVYRRADEVLYEVKKDGRDGLRIVEGEFL